MKTVALSLLVVLACGLSAFGSDCIVTSYDKYVGTSCGIDDKTFSNFSYSSTGTNTLPASSITVNPITTQFNPGFLFNARGERRQARPKVRRSGSPLTLTRAAI